MAEWTDALTKAEKRAKRAGILVSAAVMVALVLVFFGAVVLLIPGIVSSAKPAPWLLVVLTLVGAVPNVLEIVDRIAPNTENRRYERPFKWIARVVGTILQQRAYRRIFALQGAEEVSARVLLEEDAARYTVIRQRRRQRRVRLGILVSATIIIVTLAIYIWPTDQGEPRLNVGQPFHLGTTFEVTVKGRPTCARADGDNMTCDVILSFTNISHEDQTVGEGSFGSVGPQRYVFYRQAGFYQEYAIALVSAGDYFSLSRANFEHNQLKAGEMTTATFTFGVRDGIAGLDELALEAYGVASRIHVRF